MHSHYNPESSEHPHRLSWHETQDLTDYTARRRDRVLPESSKAGKTLPAASRCH
jgi:hypothetical protein